MLELHSVAVLHEVYEKHSADEAYGAEHADRREILHRVISVGFEDLVGH